MIRLFTAVRTAVTVLTVLVGPPILLVFLAGNPMPAHRPSTAGFRVWLSDPLRPEYVPATARATAWLIWALFAGTILAAGLLHARRWGRRDQWARLAAWLPGPVQGLAATLLGAATVTTAVGVPPAHAAAATTSDTAAPAHGNTLTASPEQTGTSELSDHRPPSASRTVVVQHGDTLWGLAAGRLGDPHRWTQIYRLNVARYPRMDGGDHIEPGWRLALPSLKATPEHRTPQPGTPTAAPSGRAGSSHTAQAGHHAPPATAATGRTATPKSTGHGTVPADGHSAASRDQAAGISLPGGSWLDLGLATSIATVAALVWANRRRRYTRRPLSAEPHLDDPDIAPMPPVVTQVRRGLRRAATHDDQVTAAVTGAEPGSPLAGPAGGPTPVRSAGGAAYPPANGDSDDRHDTVPAPVDLAGPATDTGPGAVTPPTAPTAAHPSAAVWSPAGLGLIGPGAQAAARGVLSAALAGGVGAPEQRSQVVMPSTAATALLGPEAATLSHTPRLTVTTGLSDALDLLEAHVLHRSRLVDTYEADSVAELRTLAPAEDPLAPILLIADAATDDQRTRIAALLAQGQRLDVHGVLLRPWPGGNTIEVAADGTTRAHVDDETANSALPSAGRMTVLSAAQTAELMAALAESHAAMVDHAWSPAHLPAETRDVEAFSAPAADDASAGGTATDRETPMNGAGPRSRDGEQEPGATAPAPRPVEVSVLGQPTITNLDPQRPPRKKALELLVYLAVQDGAASADAILEDLLPEAPSSKAAGRLYTYVSDLRAVLGRTGGRATYVTHPGHRYALNRDALSVDLWRMRQAIRDAEHAADPQQRIETLRRATEAYRGPLADGEDYEWMEPYREAIRRQALDAFLALADALADDPAAQITVLDTALRHDPYAEHLYQQAMRTRAALGQADAVQALYRAAERVLAEIDAEPSETTAELARQLITQLQRTAATQQVTR